MRNLLIVAVFGFILLNVPNLEASEAQERIDLGLVIPSNTCYDMGRDKTYSTPSYKPRYDGFVFNRTHNCEDVSGADGYSGEVDIYVRHWHSGDTVFKKNDQYVPAGQDAYGSSKKTNPAWYYSSVSNWESIDGENYSGYKKIYSSIE